MMFRKQGRLECPEFLAFVRSLPCGCGEPPPSAPHHWPIKGRRRDTDDTRTCPVCAECHQRAHGITVMRSGKRLFPISAEDQTAAVDATFRLFIFEAPRESVDAMLRLLAERREGMATCAG